MNAEVEKHGPSTELLSELTRIGGGPLREFIDGDASKMTKAMKEVTHIVIAHVNKDTEIRAKGQEGIAITLFEFFKNNEVGTDHANAFVLHTLSSLSDYLLCERASEARQQSSQLVTNEQIILLETGRMVRSSIKS